MILDIGPETARAYAAVLRDAKTIVFNGPMGVYEKPPYQNGTRVVGEAIAEATRHGATSVVGGGDAAAAAHALGFADAMTHVSTGGGATLEFLEGKTLPGVAALEARSARERAQAADRRELEDAQDDRADARVRRGRVRARPAARRRRRGDLPAVHRAVRRARSAGGLARSASGAQNMNWAERGRVHRRDLAADAGRVRRRVGRDRPLRAARAVRRARLPRQREGDARRSRTGSRRSSPSARRPTSTPPDRRATRCARRCARRSTGCRSADVARCVVAYEPIWAIGTGNADSPRKRERDHGRDPRARSPGSRTRASSTAAA